jgi:SagB-type dehydrogenase family enzyme
MLWSGQGVTADWGGRTSPSAKSTYPLSIYVVVNKVDGLDQGLYQYLPGDRTPLHQLKTIKKGNFGDALFTAQNQNSFKNTPAIFIITGNMTRMAQAFGGVASDKEVYLEAGHAAQNMYLQAESLKLGMVTISSFKDSIIRNIISIPEEETIIYLIPFGHPKE